ncbi:MAG: zinc D-Ala-D-Ala carboxypeptidase [Frankiaceae bacterium]|nr:zinc D-Ala-D-Ala carboxypeptidase [Frankiaceae bacterium]
MLSRRMLSRWKKRIAAPLVAVAVGVTLAASACAPPAPSGINPINGYNKPTKPVGVTNGNLPVAKLSNYSGSCRFWSQATGPATAMALAARKAGVNLVFADCYRDYAGQVYWRTWWCNVGKCGNAAVPGTSNHGWGKAADIHDSSGGMPTNGSGYKWLKANAGRFGFINPILTNEAWHWEWVGDGGTMRGYQVRPGLFAWPLRQGMNNGEVKTLQSALRAKGYNVVVDGSFGAGTAGAVKNFQARNGLTADGVVGGGTAWALRMFS